MLIIRLKQTILKLIEAYGYEILERPHGGGYAISKKLSFGTDPIADAKIILGNKVHCIFDVGAHCGQTALGFANAFPHATIYSFEPDPESYLKLSKLTRAHERIKSINAGLGNKNEEATFFVNKFSQTNSLLPTSAEAQEYLVAADQMDLQSTTTVQVLTLDEFCTEHAIDKIDLLKIDAQGYELKVLEGAQGLLNKQAIPLIYLEVCFVPFYEGQPLFQHTYEYLFDRDYRLVGLYESGFHTHYYRVGGNALFVHKSRGKRRKQFTA